MGTPAEDLIDLAAAIQKLPDPIRSVLMLRCEGLRIVDIARRLRLSPTRVHSAMAAGLLKLTAGFVGRGWRRFAI
jgi:DNA-directed RNA polymerase specialized sigma24 family protein